MFLVGKKRSGSRKDGSKQTLSCEEIRKLFCQGTSLSRLPEINCAQHNTTQHFPYLGRLACHPSDLWQDRNSKEKDLIVLTLQFSKHLWGYLENIHHIIWLNPRLFKKGCGLILRRISIPSIFKGTKSFNLWEGGKKTLLVFFNTILTILKCEIK